MVVAALGRASAYEQAGADGLFVPGLQDERLIGRLVAGATLPVNIMAGATTPPIQTLARLGVARVSYGPGPFLSAMKALKDAATAALA